jgi:hypothetical protein
MGTLAMPETMKTFNAIGGRMIPIIEVTQMMTPN